MKKIFFLAAFIAAGASLVLGAQQSRIELKDGSVFEGEVVSFSDGKYTVQSPSLGTLRIEKSKVLAIRGANAAAGAPLISKKDMASLDTNAVQSEVQKLQPAILGDPEIMKSLPAMLSNPDIQALLQDPEMVKAAKTMDIKTLLANEKFIKLVNSPAIKEINQKVKAKKEA